MLLYTLLYDKTIFTKKLQFCKGGTILKHFFTSHVGIGSKAYDVEGDLNTMHKVDMSFFKTRL